MAIARNRFLPWHIALGLIAAFDSVMLLLTDEGPAELAQQSLVIAVSVVALGLAYLTFKSEG